MPRRFTSLDLSNNVRKIGTHYIAIGDHADVWGGELVNSNRRQKVAVKVLRGAINRPRFVENLKRDLEARGRIWAAFQHDHIVPFHGFALDFGVLPSLILDFYPNGNINEFLKKHSTDNNQKFTLTCEIASGMRYLHRLSSPVVHGDIRGANILISADGHAALTDYGLAHIIDNSNFTTTKIVGPARWMAPELSDPSDDQATEAPLFTTESDVFAFAMTIVEVFTESLPFRERKRDSAVLFAIIAGKRPELPASIREQGLANLIQKCWDQHPELRPTADEICKELNACR